MPTPTPTRSETLTPTPAQTLSPLLRGQVLTALPTSASVVALTFDGGASDSGVQSILRTLSEERVPATFFVTGEFARRYPAQLRAMAAAGHVIGNHSDTHPDFTTLGATAQREQLARAEGTIRELTGATTRPWFRFPFGASSASAVTTVNGAGYACIGWTVDTLGWKGTSGGQTADSVVARVLASARPGQIVLLHVGANPADGSTLDADALPRIIDSLRGAGYRFVWLADLAV